MKYGKKKITILIISIVVFLLLIFGATFAIIAATTTYDNKNINMAIGSRPIFTAGPSNTIAFDIPFVSGTSAEVYEMANETSPFNITLQTNYEEKTTCTYDIVWEWDQTSDASKQYTKTSGAAKEFTVSGTSTDGSFTDVQLNDYNSSDRTTLLYSGSITAAGNNVLKTQAWTFTTSFYKTTQDQSNHRAKQYTGKIKTDNVVCGKSVEVNSLLEEVVAKSNQTSSQSNGGTWAIVGEAYYTIGHGLRYEGKDPDNYICFSSSCTDDTLYRIVGQYVNMVDTNNDGIADTNKNVIKIVKNKSINEDYWNENCSNSWSSATLKTYLNTTWVAPTNNIVTTRWYVGESSSTSQTVSQLITSERSSSWDGRIALVSMSDYAYAVLNTDCSHNNAISNYSGASCYQNNWLYYGSEDVSNRTWTLTPRGTGSVYYYATGLISNGDVCDSTRGVRPAFYLDFITAGYTSGDGSKSNPYIYSFYEPNSDPNLISFTMEFGGVSYAEPGMTWQEWVNSPYNVFFESPYSSSSVDIYHFDTSRNKLWTYRDGGSARYEFSTTAVGTGPTSGSTYTHDGTYNPAVCFTEDTKVKTDKGYKIIKDIQVGDKVYSYNEDSDKVETNNVINTFENKTDTLYEIKSGNRIINITENHKVYVKSKYGYEYKWIKAKDIKEGDYLYSIDGKEVSIDSIKIHKLDKEIKVYNLEIENNHTYYVTENDYLVHNAC